MRGTNGTSYADGLQSEAEVIDALRRAAKGASVRKSLPWEDMQYDIDAWLDAPTGAQSLSIKTQHAALQTGNVGFEVETLDRATGEWRDSWFRLGKADTYLIRVGREVYAGGRLQLHKLVARNGFDRVASLNPGVKADQGTHSCADVRFGLLNMQRLVRGGTFKLLFRF